MGLQSSVIVWDIGITTSAIGSIVKVVVIGYEGETIIDVVWFDKVASDWHVTAWIDSADRWHFLYFILT